MSKLFSPKVSKPKEIKPIDETEDIVENRGKQGRAILSETRGKADDETNTKKKTILGG